jgi:membrane-associated phospholipid phosphatase
VTKAFRLVAAAALSCGFIFAAPAARAQSQGSSSSGFTLLTDEVTHDFKYMLDNIQMDAVDIVTSPLHVADEDSVLRKPDFYLVLAGVGAAWAGSFAADQTMRSHLRDMSNKTANDLQNASYATIGAASVLVYGYGLYSNDRKKRETILTAAEAAGLSTLLDEFVIKYAFGRLRPKQDHHSHTQFFDGGKSFVSGDATPMFALAAGISEAFDNRWYVAIPAYSAAMADGFGRMGHDAHWFSDIVGAAILGAGTTELLLYMHRKHETEADRWRIFPVNAPSGRSGETPMGLGVSYNW